MADWYTATPDGAERLVGAWPEAPIENEELCSSILEVAKGQVIAYAPEPPTPTGEWVDGYYVTVTPETPSRYVYAQLQQAINLWNAGRVSSSGDVGDGGFTFTPRPLDKTIRQIIRPVDGKPHVL